MLKLLRILPFALLVAACAPTAPQISIRSDEFGKEIDVLGAPQIENPVMHYNPHMWRLRSFVNKDTHEIRHEAYVYINYKGKPKNFRYAYDDRATMLKTISLNKTNCMGDTCIKSEAVGIPLDEAELRSHLATGLRIKLRAKSGDAMILGFTPEMIRMQLDATGRIAHLPPGAPLPVVKE